MQYGILATKRFWFVVAVAVSGAAAYCFDIALDFETDALHNVYRNLGILLVIAIFMERAIEIFLSTWRSGGADRRDARIQDLRDEISLAVHAAEAAKRDNRPDKEKQARERAEDKEAALKEALKDRADYRIESREVALRGGFLLGVFIAAVGVRGLEGVVIVPEGTDAQFVCFRLIDILVTGAALSGGSEFFNQFIKLLKTFMQTTSDKAKTKEPGKVPPNRDAAAPPPGGRTPG
mgnify:CR=1 FL=1